MPTKGGTVMREGLESAGVTRSWLLFWATLLTAISGMTHLIGAIEQPPAGAPLLTILYAAGAIELLLAVLAFVSVSRVAIAIAALVNAVTLAFWLLAHLHGLWIGAGLWKPETLSVPDLYLPYMEVAATVLYVCVWARLWSSAPALWRTIWTAVPWLSLAGIVVWS